MAKRTADKELTHDNWDQEQEEEEAGRFRCATKEVLKTREIKKAKRRGVTDDKGGAGAFKGFSFGVTTTTASSKPVSFTMQTSNASTGDSAPKSVASVAVGVSDGSKSASPKSSSGDAESQYRQSLRTLNESVLRWIDDHIKTNPYCILTPVFSDYEKYIKELDREFPQSSDKVVDKTPLATSADAAAAGFSFSSFGANSTFPSAVGNSETSMSVTNLVVSNSHTSMSVTNLVSSGNSEERPLAPPTSNTAVATGSSAPRLIFGAPDSKAVTGFGCGTMPSVGATSSSLNHGTTSPACGTGFGVLRSNDTIAKASFGARLSKEPATSPASKEANPFISGFNFGSSQDAVAKTSGFSFGAQPSKDPATSPASTGANSPMAGFNFGPPKDTVAETSGFGFGSQPSKEPASTGANSGFNFGSSQDAVAKASGFSFGAQPSKDPATSPASTGANSLMASFNFGPPKDTVAETSGFSFGAQPSKEPTIPPSSICGFNFGQQSSKESNSTPAPGFRFSILPANEATASDAQASTSAPNQGGDDDTYVPPKPEVVDIKEDDAFYTVRCKLYCKTDNVFKDRGVGNLYLKPCGEKTQLLMRAGTALGNILLNILLNKNIPTSRQANNVTLVCVPNPPLDEKKPDDKTPVCMLLRVKTAEEAEALLKQLNDHKNV